MPNNIIEVDKISENPLDRVHPKMKELINDDETSYDIHCHIMNFESVPKKYGFMKLPTEYQAKHNMVDKIEDILHILKKDTETDFASNIAYFLDFGNQKSIKEVADKLISYYPEKTIFTPLMMDMEWGWESKPFVPYDKQIENMQNLRNNVFPDKILPFIAIDPNNPNVFEIFSNALINSGGFFGVKIYPALGYLPSDNNLMKIFEVCEKKNIPVTTHCGGNSIHTTKQFIRVQGQEIDTNGELEPIDKTFTHLNPFASKKIGEFFNDPKNWESVLYSFPKLKLNFAHFAGGDEWEKMKNNETSQVARIFDFMAKYDNVFADVSSLISNRTIYNLIRKKIEDNEKIRSRTLYGSDFYMVTTAGNFRLMKADFIAAMGDDIMQQISKINPKQFLFSKPYSNTIS